MFCFNFTIFFRSRKTRSIQRTWVVPFLDNMVKICMTVLFSYHWIRNRNKFLSVRNKATKTSLKQSNDKRECVLQNVPNRNCDPRQQWRAERTKLDYEKEAIQHTTHLNLPIRLPSNRQRFNMWKQIAQTKYNENERRVSCMFRRNKISIYFQKEAVIVWVFNSIEFNWKYLNITGVCKPCD